MKTVFAAIGCVVVCMWMYHFFGNKVIKPVVSVAADTAWNATAPYLNNAVNKAQEKTK